MKTANCHFHPSFDEYSILVPLFVLKHLNFFCLISRYKDNQNCCDIIAEALDPDGKISPLQISRTLKQLGYRIPRKKKTVYASAPDKPGNEEKDLESEIRLQNSDILEEGTSQRRHL